MTMINCITERSEESQINESIIIEKRGLYRVNQYRPTFTNLLCGLV